MTVVGTVVGKGSDDSCAGVDGDGVWGVVMLMVTVLGDGDGDGGGEEVMMITVLERQVVGASVDCAGGDGGEAWGQWWW